MFFSSLFSLSLIFNYSLRENFLIKKPSILRQARVTKMKKKIYQKNPFDCVLALRRVTKGDCRREKRHPPPPFGDFFQFSPGGAANIGNRADVPQGLCTTQTKRRVCRLSTNIWVLVLRPLLGETARAFPPIIYFSFFFYEGAPSLGGSVCVLRLQNIGPGPTFSSC